MLFRSQAGELRVAGGGTRSRPLVEGIVDALGRPVIDVGEPEAALWGAARLAVGADGPGGPVAGFVEGTPDRLWPRPVPWREARYQRYRAWKEKER